MIFRIADTESHFTTFPNQLLKSGDGTKPREDSLSPAALGLLCYLLSHKEDWVVTGTIIAKHFQITKNQVTKLTDELRDAGYLRRSFYHCEKKGTTLPNWDVTNVRNQFRDPDIRDPDNRDPDYEELISNNLEEVISKKEDTRSRREVFLAEPPAGIAGTSWRKWWEYKLGPRGRVPQGSAGQAKITRVTNEFRVLISAGASDSVLEKIVDHHIANGWRSLGEPDWRFTKNLLEERKMMRGVT